MYIACTLRPAAHVLVACLAPSGQQPGAAASVSSAATAVVGGFSAAPTRLELQSMATLFGQPSRPQFDWTLCTEQLGVFFRALKALPEV
jgi:hypothetical protein